MFQWLMFKRTYTDFNTLRNLKRQKATTAACLKRSCAQQRTVRKLFKDAFTCKIPQLYANQVSSRSMQRQPRLLRDKKRTAFQLYIRS